MRNRSNCKKKAGAIFTITAWFYHLSLALANNFNITILFPVKGLAQMFWAIPPIGNWGIMGSYRNCWNYCFYNHLGNNKIPDNPITGRGGPIGRYAIIMELSQIMFVILLVILVSKRKKSV